MNPTPRKDHLLTETVGGECVVYNTQTKKAHSLNAPVAWVWQHCDGLTSTVELTRLFQQEFNSDEAPSIVASALDQLRAAGLLESASDERMSRRAVVAAGSALAPVVASIVVPSVRAAASGNPGKGKGPDDGKGKGPDDGKGKGKGKG